MSDGGMSLSVHIHVPELCVVCRRVPTVGEKVDVPLEPMKAYGDVLICGWYHTVHLN